MQCDDFDRRLQRVLDRRRSPDLDYSLRQHAETCARCRGRLATTRKLLRGLELLESPTLDRDFALRVVQQVAPPQHRRMTATWLLLATAVAATLAVAILPLWRTRGSATATPIGIASAQPTSTDTWVPSTPPSTQVAAVEPLDLPWWSHYGNSILELYPEETRLRHRQHVSELAEDLRPIASPFNAAATVIRRTIPLGRPESKTPPNASIEPRSPNRASHA